MWQGFDQLESTLRQQGLDPAEELPALSFYNTSLEALTQCFQEAGSQGKLLIIHDGVPKHLMDDRCRNGIETHARAGNSGLELGALLNQLCSGSGLENVIIFVLDPSNGFPRPENLASFEITERVAAVVAEEEPAAVLVLGSGSVTDVVKHALFRADLNSVKLWVLPTALTVTAYTSRFSVLEKSQIKQTHDSRRADRVIFALDLLSGAPRDLQNAGLGDLLGGLVSYADWRLAHLLGQSTFRAQAYELMKEMNRTFLPDAPSVPDAGGEADEVSSGLRVRLPSEGLPVQRIAAALSAAGVAMNLGGSSAPQSGGEHGVSHVLDFLRSTSRRLKWSHGLQVALATDCSCSFYDSLRVNDFIPFNRLWVPEADELEALVCRIFSEAPFLGGSEFSDLSRRDAFWEENGSVLEESVRHFLAVAADKRRAWLGIRADFGEFQKKWERHRTDLLASVPTQASYSSAMRYWGLPLSPEEMSPPGTSQEFRWALRFSPFYRLRFGIQDLLFFLGEDPAIVAAI